ncbi:MAG: peptidoglycan editing factor PgeF [Devosiaceae bacterium]|nr:peptidoglycan editing factor PgeF [Devosiaceae bacterium MH13]
MSHPPDTAGTLLEPITHPLLGELPGIKHAFFTRRGGVSGGIYNSLNSGLGSRDDPQKVLENRERMRAHMGGTHLLTVYQHHSELCVRTEAPWQPQAAPRADALVTRTPGLIACAQAADCGPILFADPDARVVGAAHAGWKGALYGVLEATIEAMEAEGANRSRIVAVLGPSISKAAYEVGPEFIDRFTSAAPSNARYFSPSKRSGHAMFDLQGYTVDRLRAAGITAQMVGRCTYSEPDLFFSYRRTTHRGEPDHGRLASAIMLT